MMDPSDIRVGIDIADEADFARIQHERPVLEKMFTRSEIEDCLSRVEDCAAALARRFAAKEAVIKACGKDISAAREIEIFNDEAGRPHVRWAYLEEEKLRAEISLSSRSPLAVAVAIVRSVSECSSPDESEPR